MESREESRAHPRAKAQIKVDYHHGATTGIGHTVDISEGGIYLICDHPAKVGTRVYLRLYLPNSASPDPLKLIGEVTRITNLAAVYDDTPPGMGIAFQVAYSRTKDELHEFMEMLFVEGDGGNLVDTLHGDGGPAYIARFPDTEGPGSMRPAQLDAAFNFTATSRSGVEPPPAEEEGDDSLVMKLALGLVVLAIVVWIVAKVIGNGP